VSDPRTVPAAGAVVWRPSGDGTVADVLLIHRPRYDDWSFPKGKLDPGEPAVVAAVREVAEETGVVVRLGSPLPEQEYATAAGLAKQVRYWAARPVDDTTDVSAFTPNAEVDQVAWVGVDQARRRLSYPRDVAVLDAFAGTDPDEHAAAPLLLLRHTQAQPRESWPHDDRDRPLAAEGQTAARRLVPLLAAFGVRRVVSSDAVRCATTVEPYAEHAGLRVETDPRLSEEGDDDGVTARVTALLHSDEPLVVCSHRPMLPSLFRALGVPDPALEPGGFVVVHRHAGRVVGVELHQP
jgi:8-oxo-dGTP diphosphatase